MGDHAGGDSPVTLFVDVILPLAIGKAYTYRVPALMNSQAEPGKRAVVQFGRNKVYAGLISAVHTSPPPYEAKYLLDIPDEHPVAGKKQLELWKWMADYYLCTEGEVLNAALPAGLKLASETHVLLSGTEINKEELDDKEFMVIEALELHHSLPVNTIARLLEQKNVFRVLRRLLEKRVILVEEEMAERFKPKKETFIRLSERYSDKEALKTLLDGLEHSPKQQEAVMWYLKTSRDNPEPSKKIFMQESGVSPAVLQSLIGKEVFIAKERIVSRLGTEEPSAQGSFSLSEAQEKTIDKIREHFLEKRTVLLHGITSSGKTELYIRLMEECIASGRQALYLLPEIALTAQIISRLRKYFHEHIGVYHSKFNDNERVETWNKVLNGSYKAVIGARSSVFLPFSNLGLIIVDEEHEQSFKQFDPAPRYHARDTAIYLGKLYGANVLLGSATPSIESYFNARTGKYMLAELKERYGGVEPPRILVADLQEETRRKMNSSHFSSLLLGHLNETLAKKDQAILFQNRRGYAPVLSCLLCAYTPKCIHCDVSLTYHKSVNKLQCHYCGYRQDTLRECPACGNTKIDMKGFGTEKVEDELAILMPGVRIGRMDIDTMKNKHAHQQILTDFEEGNIDVLVGTQMVSKGLDFPKVSLSGILSADQMLNYPDFRAYERSYQLMAQVSGRAGRRDKQGVVVIQAFQAKHPVIHHVIKHDYESLYNDEIRERRQFNYPPFCRLIKIDIKHKKPDILEQIAEELGKKLRISFGDRILGPESPPVGRIKNYYLKTILIKLEREGLSFSKAKERIRQEINAVQQQKGFSSVIIQADVDPY